MLSRSLDDYEVKRPYFLHLVDSRRIFLHKKSAHRSGIITVVTSMCRTCTDQDDTDLLVDFFKKMVSIDTIHLDLLENSIEELRLRKEDIISVNMMGYPNRFRYSQDYDNAS